MSYLSLLVNIILRQYFYETNCIFYISESSFVEIQNLPVYIFDLRTFKYADKERCENFIITAEKPAKLFSKIELHIQRQSKVRYNNRKYIFIVQNQDAFDDIFKASSLQFVMDILVISIIYKDKEEYFDLYTHQYVARDNKKPILLDKWFSRNSSFLFCKNLFPNKMQNQMGRHLKFAGMDYLPYSDLGKKTGFEYNFAMEYAKLYNFTYSISDDFWGQMYSNWTGNGILGGVATDIYDIGFSALFIVPSRLIYADFSLYTTYSRVTCLVPAPREKEGWFTYLNVFDYKLWILIVLSYAGLVICLNMMTALRFGSTRTKRKSITLFILFGIFSTQSVPNKNIPKGKAKVLFIMILYFTLIYNVMYNSGLSSILVAPSYSGQIETVQDLSRAGINWGESAVDWVIPLEVDITPIYRDIYNKFKVLENEALREYSINGNHAFGMERLTSGYYAVGSYITEDVIGSFRVMREDLYKQYTCFSLRKNSVLLNSFNRLLGRATETGLMNYWQGEAMSHTNTKVQMALMYPTSAKNLTSLKMSHVKGIFIFWIAGILLASVKFCHEYRSYSRISHI